MVLWSSDNGEGVVALLLDKDGHHYAGGQGTGTAGDLRALYLGALGHHNSWRLMADSFSRLSLVIVLTNFTQNSVQDNLAKSICLQRL